MKLDAAAPHESVDGSGLRVAVARATFNDPVTSGLRDGALEWLTGAGVADVTVVDVPGAFELPLIARALAATHDGVVALGAVILGDTDHYEHVAHRASEGLQQVMLETGKPVAFGILTVRDPEQARVRSAPGPANKGAEAAEAVVRTALLLRQIEAQAGS
jgi:6,7-dimethyl-8-ribityllumazine synthase